MIAANIIQMDKQLCACLIVIAVLLIFIMRHRCTEGIRVIKMGLSEGLVRVSNATSKAEGACGRRMTEGACGRRMTEGYSNNIISEDVRSATFGVDRSIGQVGGVQPRTFHSKDPSEIYYGRGPMVGGLPSTEAGVAGF